MSPEEKQGLLDLSQLISMQASESDAREIIRRTLIMIEQTKIVLLELDKRHW